MRRILVLVALAVIGCVPPAGHPEIQVRRAESTSGVDLTVYYVGHNSSDNNKVYAVIDTPEKLANYRKQVEFLLMQLDDAERRMKVHEPEVKK